MLRRFVDHAWWPWLRLGGRFLTSYDGLKAPYFMWQPCNEALATQMVNTVLGRITSSLAFQYNQPEMMVQVRVQIAFFNALLQPLNVALGLNYFDNCSEATEQTLAFDKRLDGYIAKMAGTASDSESVGRAVAAAANTAVAARAAAALHRAMWYCALYVAAPR